MDKASAFKILSGNGVSLTEDQTQLLSQYVDQLLAWNSKINLVSRANDDVWGSHIIHSLALLFIVDLPAGIRIIDIGTGGGLPGIPLAIARPDISFVLVDSVKKKINAVSDMLMNLALPNVSAMSGRTEELKKNPDLCQSFDISLARAVAPLHELVAWSKPFARHSSYSLRLIRTGESFQLPALLAMKGGDISGEVEMANRKALTNSRVVGISFDGIDRIGLDDKKLVITNL
ncbi:MAG: 16S rRNA (guanine(527)-N(7))-methyltransferase RsmG [Bacteroidota bacterium]